MKATGRVAIGLLAAMLVAEIARCGAGIVVIVGINRIVSGGSNSQGSTVILVIVVIVAVELCFEPIFSLIESLAQALAALGGSGL